MLLAGIDDDEGAVDARSRQSMPRACCDCIEAQHRHSKWTATILAPLLNPLPSCCSLHSLLRTLSSNPQSF
eukprot:1516481-Rhodomonas_salina.1